MYGIDDGSLRWLYLDLNSFFASVEQQLHPELRGKAVAVLPLMAESTSVIAASYEAKAFGIKTGTRVREARRLCPGIKFVVAQHGPYVEVHQQVNESIEKILPVNEICSIDEFACALMGRERMLTDATRLAQAIKAQIYRDVGEHIHASIGLAPSRYLAKVAADMKKPNGLTALFKRDLPSALLGLKPRDLPGIGEQMEKRLLRNGIDSLEKLLSLSEQEMRSLWGGVWGERLWHWVRGEEIELPESKRSSLSHSHVLAPQYRNPEGARLIAQKLLHKLASRLRKSGLYARKLSLHVRFSNETLSVDEQCTIPECCDDLTLLEYFKTLWLKTPPFAEPRKVSLALSDLVEPYDHTLPLFNDPKREYLVRALDQVHEKFGKKMLYFASQNETKGAAPPRIAFDSIPDVESEGDGFEPE